MEEEKLQAPPQDAGQGDIRYLALYGFRSKQEYIYRTNKLREITGASDLMAGIFGMFLEENDYENPNKGNGPFARLKICNDWREGKRVSGTGRKIYDTNSNDNTESIFEKLEKKELDGIVVYEGGGNLCVLFRNRDAYINANRAISYIVMDKGYSLGVFAAGVPWEGDRIDGNLSDNIKRVHKALDERKRMIPAKSFRNVLPFTDINRDTSQAVFQYFDEKENRGTDRGKQGAYPCSYESHLKRETYGKANNPDQAADITHAAWDRETSGKWLDDITTNKGTESLLAAVYVDGNSMGEKLKQAGKTLQGMRKFSVGTNETFVGRTADAMVEAISKLSALNWQPTWNIEGDLKKPDPGSSYRIIVDHGDEITLICNAHAVPAAIKAYFNALKNQGEENTACMGIAVFHSHDPFSEVYKIAEECCEQGKKRNRECIREKFVELKEKLSVASDHDSFLHELGITQDDIKSQSEDITKNEDKKVTPEEAKERAIDAALMDVAKQAADASYVDFHFCRSGITGNLEQIREAQEDHLIMRPYRITDYRKRINATTSPTSSNIPFALLLKTGHILYESVNKTQGGISRADIKAFGSAAMRGKSTFLLEWERACAKDRDLRKIEEEIAEDCCWVEGVPQDKQIADADERLMRIIFDVSGFYDIWFAHDEQNLPKPQMASEGSDEEADDAQ